MPKLYPELKSSRVIKKFEGNPILTKDDVPYDAFGHCRMPCNGKT